MRLQFAALREGSAALVNIADVKIKGVVYPLSEWAVKAGVAAGFRHIKTNHYQLHRFLGSGGEDNKRIARTEDVIVFRKE